MSGGSRGRGAAPHQDSAVLPLHNQPWEHRRSCVTLPCWGHWHSQSGHPLKDGHPFCTLSNPFALPPCPLLAQKAQQEQPGGSRASSLCPDQGTQRHREQLRALPPSLQGVMAQQGSPCTHSHRCSSGPGLAPALSQTTKSGSTQDSLSKMQLLEASGVFYTRSQALSKDISGNAQTSIQGATGAAKARRGSRDSAAKPGVAQHGNRALACSKSRPQGTAEECRRGGLLVNHISILLCS